VIYNSKTHTVKMSTVHPEDKPLLTQNLQAKIYPGLKGLQSLSTTNTGTFSAAEYKNNLYYMQIEGKNVNIPGRHIKPHKARAGYCKMRYRGKIFRIKSDKIKLSRQCISKPILMSPENGSPCSVRSQQLYNEGIGFPDTRAQSPSQMSQDVSVCSNVSKASVRYPHFSELLRSVPNIVPDKYALMAASTNKARCTTKTTTKTSVKTNSAAVEKRAVRVTSRNTSRNTFNQIETIPEVPTQTKGRRLKTQRTTKVICGQQINLKVMTSPAKEASPLNIQLDVKTPPQLKLDPLSLPDNISITGCNNMVKQEMDIVIPLSHKKKSVFQKKLPKFTISIADNKQSHKDVGAHQEKDFVLTNLRRSPSLVCQVEPVLRPQSNNTLFINCDDLVQIPLKVKASQSVTAEPREVHLEQQVSSNFTTSPHLNQLLTTTSECQQLGGIGYNETQRNLNLPIGDVGVKGSVIPSRPYIQRVTSGNQDLEIKLLSVAQHAIT